MEVSSKSLSMKFHLCNSLVILQGEPRLSKSGVSLKAMVREISHEGQGYWEEFSHLPIDAEIEDQSVPLEVQAY